MRWSYTSYTISIYVIIAHYATNVFRDIVKLLVKSELKLSNTFINVN